MSDPNRHRSRLKYVATVGLAWSLAAAVSAVSLMGSAPSNAASTPRTPDRVVETTAPPLDRSGQAHVGKASFYADRYSGKTMADGTPMRLYSNNAASLTLPLGTTARVINLETGRSTWVTIRDRGPYVKGRIIDLSPVTARKIGLSTRQGVATVKVVPLTIPMSDGTVKTMPVHLAMLADASRSMH